VNHRYHVRARHERFRGPVFSLVTDEVAMPDGRYVDRDYIVHIGAVAVVAVDDADRVVLIRQYRHPLGVELWELPAGLVDVVGEPLPATAARELAEEADLTAARWDPLVDLHTSPGCSTELIRLYLARDLRPVPDGERHTRTHEETHLAIHRVDLDEAVQMALRGEITNAACVAGVLAAARVRDDSWAGVGKLT
jgi:ADP-ribose pyrophosphatase